MTLHYCIYFIFLSLLTGRGLLDGLTDAVQQTIVDNKGSEMLLTVIQNLQDKHNAMVETGEVHLTSTVSFLLCILNMVHYIIELTVYSFIGRINREFASRMWKTKLKVYSMDQVHWPWKPPQWGAKKGRKTVATYQQYALSRLLGLSNIHLNTMLFFQLFSSMTLL